MARSVDVAVIGDVGVDWSFLPNQPPRARQLALQPWTQYPAASLFAFPAGAWFFGHMVKAALHTPKYSRRFEATLLPDPDTNCSDVLLEGTLGELPSDFSTETLSDLRNDKSEIYISNDSTFALNIVINDNAYTLFPPGSLCLFTITGTEVGLGPKLTLHMTQGRFAFSAEDSARPGRIVPNQIARNYHLESACLLPHPGTATRTIHGITLSTFTTCSSLYIIGSPLRVTVGLKGPEGQPLPLNMKPGPITSFRIMTDNSVDLQRLRANLSILIRPRADGVTPCAYLSKATLDVSEGRFEVIKTTLDTGKLSTWRYTGEPDSAEGAATAPDARRPVLAMIDKSQQIDAPPKTESMRPSADDVTRGQEPGQLREDVLGVTTSECPTPVGARVWLYSNPYRNMSTQRPAHVVHTLNQINHFALDDDDRRVYRQSAQHGIDGPAFGHPTILGNYLYTTDTDLDAKWSTGGSNRVVIVDDEGHGFCSWPNLWRPFLYRYNGAFMGTPQDKWTGKDIIDLCRNNSTFLEECEKHLKRTVIFIKASHWLHLKESALLTFLGLVGAADRTILVVSGESLRGGRFSVSDKPGIKLSKTASWERTVEDFCSALSEGKLDILGSARHFIVRLGQEGALYCHRFESAAAEPRLQLVFDPARIEGEFAPPHKHGSFPGLTTVVSSYLAKAVIGAMCMKSPQNSFEPNGEFLHETIEAALPSAMAACRRYFEFGYGSSIETVRKFERLQVPMSRIFSKAATDNAPDDKWDRFPTFPLSNLTDISESKPWSILTHFLSAHRDYGPTKATMGRIEARPEAFQSQFWRAFNALRLGKDIVVRGAEKAFSMPGADFPYAQFGELMTVDRSEIEGLRSVQTVLEEYARHPKRKTPIAIAVFGPPGSGKSFGVKQIASRISDGKLSEFTFNLAQFQSFQEVAKLLLQVRDAGLDDRLPLVFFDEFDSPLGQAPLGWLKFFLAPMQDGKFQHEGATFNLGRAILVFAGGIAQSHSKFQDETSWEEGGKEANGTGVFRAAKGTDFHSRLRGFLNVVGINPTLRESPDVFAVENFTFVIRRALLVRQVIERLNREGEGRVALLDVNKCASIESDIVHALLLAEEYTHGVRSLIAILEMSAIYGEQSITRTALPSMAQCLMHVDRSFFAILQRNYPDLRSRIAEEALSAIAGERTAVGSEVN